MGESENNAILHQTTPADEPSSMTLIPESSRFNSYPTHISGVSIRTEKNAHPKILGRRYRALLTSFAEWGRELVTIHRERKRKEVEEAVYATTLKAHAAARSDFRGFEFEDENIVVSIFPQHIYDGDKLQSFVGNENFPLVVSSDIIDVTIDITGHPEKRREMEFALRRAVRSVLKLQDDEQVEARFNFSRRISVRQRILQNLLKQRKTPLPPGVLQSTDWRITIREIGEQSTDTSQ